MSEVFYSIKSKNKSRSQKVGGVVVQRPLEIFPKNYLFLFDFGKYKTG